MHKEAFSKIIDIFTHFSLDAKVKTNELEKRLTERYLFICAEEDEEGELVYGTGVEEQGLSELLASYREYLENKKGAP
ncbi:MAG TPA: hypothetical protein VMW93_04505 [bacterium]|nr:hypothetical protein [bacterium]